ncbi:MAG: multicopper oxidase domain-containing protein [Anaerolineae bacterium]|nr:multicopper oxidase domain-containing protein [Anaerolineae bacterium]
MLKHLSRRNFLRTGAAVAAGAAALAGTNVAAPVSASPQAGQHNHGEDEHGGMDMMGASPGFATKLDIPPATADPMQILTDFDMGQVSQLPDGRTLREYQVTAYDREIEVAKGVAFPAWTYNGRVPGPTFRCTEGDLVRVKFVNAGSHPHTIHFHGIHAANQDGVFEPVPAGGTFIYEFTAEPFGLQLYHCHVMPLKKHIHKGLYGTFIIDPKTPRPPAREMVMVMNGFDLDGNGENELYTVNGVAFYFQDHPIQIKKGELVRVYLVNITEFDLINSLHIHANFFQYYPTGTSLTPSEYTDTVMLCQGQRGIMEFTYHHTGRFMFHAHQSEFAELGWMGFFEVVE